MAEKFTVVLTDLRGYGDSSKPDGTVASGSEQAGVEDGIDRAVAALELWLSKGIQPAMNQFNGI